MHSQKQLKRLLLSAIIFYNQESWPNPIPDQTTFPSEPTELPVNPNPEKSREEKVADITNFLKEQAQTSGTHYYEILLKFEEAIGKHPNHEPRILLNLVVNQYNRKILFQENISAIAQSSSALMQALKAAEKDQESPKKFNIKDSSNDSYMSIVVNGFTFYINLAAENLWEEIKSAFNPETLIKSCNHMLVRDLQQKVLQAAIGEIYKQTDSMCDTAFRQRPILNLATRSSNIYHHKAGQNYSEELWKARSSENPEYQRMLKKYKAIQLLKEQKTLYENEQEYEEVLKRYRAFTSTEDIDEEAAFMQPTRLPQEEPTDQPAPSAQPAAASTTPTVDTEPFQEL